tara:strand:- start:19 stop:213 length:195 start_codon:yes stop_codon:yes gene_type:complete
MNEKEMKNKIERLEERIEGLEKQLDEMYFELERTHVTSDSIREVMEEVAKLANQPVGMMFNYRS